MNATIIPERRGRWIPWVFVGGMALVIAVNAVLITAAVSTYSGTTVGGAYDRGRTYNHVLEEAARQRALGWTAEVSQDGGWLALSLRDAAGAALPADSGVRGVLQRPLDRTEVPLDLRAAGDGTWIADVRAAAHGQWDARIEVTRGESARLQATRRLMLP